MRQKKESSRVLSAEGTAICTDGKPENMLLEIAAAVYEE